MKLGVMQSYFFPYIGYFQLIESVDTFLIYEYVSFRKKSWITRNRLLDKKTGEPFFINIPVKGKSSNKLINEMEIIKESKWKKKLLKDIYFNYKKARFFNEIYPFLEELINFSEYNLHCYNSNSIIKICDLLDIKTKIISKDLSNITLENDIKNQNNIEKELIKYERVLRLCNKYEATSYTNPIGGVELYKRDYFKKNDVDLFFLQTNDFSYKQFGNSFTPYLSIIDQLMHVGVDETKKIIKKYKLI